MVIVINHRCWLGIWIWVTCTLICCASNYNIVKKFVESWILELLTFLGAILTVVGGFYFEGFQGCNCESVPVSISNDFGQFSSRFATVFYVLASILVLYRLSKTRFVKVTVIVLIIALSIFGRAVVGVGTFVNCSLSCANQGK